MLSIGIVGVLCNILCLAVLQKQQVGGTADAIIFGSLLRTSKYTVVKCFRIEKVSRYQTAHGWRVKKSIEYIIKVNFAQNTDKMSVWEPLSLKYRNSVPRV